MKKILCHLKNYLRMVLAIMVWSMGVNYVMASGITNYPALISPEYWQQHTVNGDKLILDSAGCRAYNKQIGAKSSSVVDLAGYSQTVTRSQVQRLLNNTSVLNKSLYENGSAVIWAKKQRLRQEMNLENVPEAKSLGYGVVVRRSNLRKLPYENGLFSSPEDTKFDELQNTALDPAQPVAVLHKSLSGKFLLVQSYNYAGWLKESDVAMTNRAEWLKWVEPQNFLMVISKGCWQNVNGEQVYYQMGSKLRFNAKQNGIYSVGLPQRRADGTLGIIKKNIAADSVNFHEGYLQYTRNNIIGQCFKYYGAEYGWGGLLNSEDCSGFVNDVYQTMGVLLPRDADTQEMTAGQQYSFSGLSTAGRYALLKNNLQAGDTLHMNGHVMIYLGQSNGIPYAIHALGSYTVHSNGGRWKNRVMRVVVSDLSLQSWSGYHHIDSLTHAMSFH